MFITERNKSKQHLYLETLAGRTKLDKKEAADLARYRSGFRGECDYDGVLDEVGHDSLHVFRDIWLRIDNSDVQFDTLIIADATIIVNEIKNYSGNYSYENSVWKVRGRQISEDPVSQVNRAAGKLVKLRNESGFQFVIQKEIIFINPYFIFSSGDAGAGSMNLFVMRNRLKQYFRSLGNNTSGRSAKVLAEEISGRIIEDPYPVPETDYTRLKPGVNCWKCGGYDIEMKRFNTVCRECGYSETVERLIVRSVVEYAVLFPDEVVTKKRIADFLGGSVNLQRTQRLMKKYFSIVPNSSRTYYQITDKDSKKILKAGGYSSYYEHDPDFMFETHPRAHKLQANFL
ncbi:nuclease-related domain-containing protein [Salinicoccus halodurans]|uniref:Nuclease-related domain-containing protein n=1 Tax=Salinicoccus halodurans TaxID=407035 RepID=A0A0F7HIR5_9STAP|nr:nuclease-related domain-containing protein [Salinicoccus halodurans]AKG73389.1 hypothetical protein AAT16_03630 [Salinicoccus halodurans]SFK81463.1 Nuclease-related domain-containing protein [Salinicoccus halodurans]